MRKNNRPKRGNVHVGIDVGSAMIRCAIVEIDPIENQIQLLGVGASESNGIKRGNIVERERFIEEMEKSLVEAEKKANIKAEHVWLSVSGEHIRGINTQGAIAIDDKKDDNYSKKGGKITEDDVHRVLEMAKAISFPTDREILHILPQEYVVDEMASIKDPIGITGRRLEARVHLVTVTTSAATNLVNCAEDLGITVNGLVFQSLASATATLDSDEKDLGVAIADIGALTTDITVFFENGVRHTGVLPIGANSITNDIAVMLRTTKNEAERIKLKYASAKASMASPDLQFELPANEKRNAQKISEHELSRYVEARMVEIFQLIGREISRTDLFDKLTYGLVVTGGGSLLPNISVLGEETLGLRVRIGKPRGLSNAADVSGNPQFAAAIGLALWALQSDDILLEEDEYLKTKDLVGKISNWFRGLF